MFLKNVDVLHFLSAVLSIFSLTQHSINFTHSADVLKCPKYNKLIENCLFNRVVSLIGNIKEP